MKNLATNVAELNSFNEHTTNHKIEQCAPFEVLKFNFGQESLCQYLSERKNSFRIFYITEGESNGFIDLNTARIEANNIYCVFPGQYLLLNNFEGIKGYCVSFSSDYVSEINFVNRLLVRSGLYTKMIRSYTIEIGDSLKDDFNEIFEKMVKEFDSLFGYKSEVLEGYLGILLVYFARQMETSSISYTTSSRIVKKFLESLSKNFTEKKMVTEYADELCITPNYLNEVVKKNTGIAASEHIKNRIIQEAKYQANFTNRSMKEIAFNLGFNDSGHFSKYFKNGSGINFTEYKSEMLLVG